MNDFCEYCTAGNKTEIRKCKDRKCPFYRDRWSNLPYQDEKRKVKKCIGQEVAKKNIYENGGLV